MKKFLSAAAVAAATCAVAVVPASAGAAVQPHGCTVSDGWVTASGYTSCAFANNISNQFDNGVARGRCVPFVNSLCSGTVYSPVTNKNYSVTCHVAHNPIKCTTSGVDSWIEFTWSSNG